MTDSKSTKAGEAAGRVSSPARGGSGKPITIKKYANRRLYNTATSSYVTLDHLCQMVKENVDFEVFDAKTGEDITRPVLTQIIVEEESKGENLLPISFLRQLISFYGAGMQYMVPTYLDQMMQAFAANQEQVAQAMQKSMGGMFSLGAMSDNMEKIEEARRQNIALFQRTMKMFSPFPNGAAEGVGEAGDGEVEELESLKQQVDKLQQQLEHLSGGKGQK
ncbi:polyhydroxyalkanoate synthesis repressor PhaR [Algihabitans sp.]|uniref:polyhydroxyalkanoate synthesis repressor PhaR n=1 Tax=Algihabitans sp. TaxID=2821514 RepID=UPI003BA842FA